MLNSCSARAHAVAVASDGWSSDASGVSEALEVSTPAFNETKSLASKLGMLDAFAVIGEAGSDKSCGRGGALSNFQYGWQEKETTHMCQLQLEASSLGGCRDSNTCLLLLSVVEEKFAQCDSGLSNESLLINGVREELRCGSESKQ